MTDPLIICPYCQKEIPLTEAISHQMRERVQKEFEGEFKRKEHQLGQKEQALIQQEKAMEEEFSQKMRLEKARVEEESKRIARESIALEMKDLNEQLKEKDQRLQESQKAELEFRKQRRELEDRQKAFELEVARNLDEEREKIREETLKSVTEQQRLKDLEKDKKINDMLRQIEDLKRKAEQGSQQTQGEVLELELEKILTNNFPVDQMEPVGKGKSGADLLQRIHNQHGQYCGTIIWESKRTKLWNEGWIDKLREDQREAKADIAVLVTTALPREVNSFAFINGIWVTHYSLATGLAIALRMNLIQVAGTKVSAVGKYEKMEVLYGYLSGPEFGQRVEAIVNAFASMKNDLDQEKRAMNKVWAKREKQIDRVINNISGMYGDLQGIVGASLPEIKSLELKGLFSEGESSIETDNHEDPGEGKPS